MENWLRGRTARVCEIEWYVGERHPACKPDASPIGVMSIPYPP